MPNSATKRSPRGLKLTRPWSCSNQPLPHQAVEHLHAEIAGQVIVADPGAAQRRVLRPGAHAHVAGARGKPRQPLEHDGDIGPGEAVIAMAALLFRGDQAAGLAAWRDANSRSAA